MAAMEDVARTVKRRGIIAAAGAVVAGIVAKQAAQPVLAAGVVLGADTNFTATKTAIINNSGSAPRVAIHGYLAANAVQAEPISFDVAVAGTIGNGTGYGVYGKGNYGVVGEGSGIGIFGKSPNYGVQGYIPADSPATGQTIGVNGVNTLNRPDAIGMLGQSTSSIGVYGASTNGTGVYGLTASSNQYGVLGQTFEVNSTAIAGTCTGNGSSAFSGGTTNPYAYAAFFQGTVVVQGNFAVTGSKSAVVQHPRTGDHRLVYCVESPEAWFEDFGSGTLTNGRAEVKLDPDFAALVHTDRYLAFLTPHDAASKGLAVTAYRADGFVVQELSGGTSNGTFAWRVVGKRADVPGERLGKFTMPTLSLPDPSKFKAPAIPPATLPPNKP